MEVTIWVVVLLVTVFIIGLIAMRMGFVEHFNISKDSGFSVTANKKADMAFLTTITSAVEEIDNGCRFRSWKYIIDNKPEFLTGEHQWQALLPLLEIVSFNHLLRQIELIGFAEYCASTQKTVSNSCQITITKRNLEKYVNTILDKCVMIAKTAAAKKIELYERHVNRTDLSEACLSLLRTKIEKNQRYGTISTVIA